MGQSGLNAAGKKPPLFAEDEINPVTGWSVKNASWPTGGHADVEPPAESCRGPRARELRPCQDLPEGLVGGQRSSINPPISHVIVPGDPFAQAVRRLPVVIRSRGPPRALGSTVPNGLNT